MRAFVPLAATICALALVAGCGGSSRVANSGAGARRAQPGLTTAQLRMRRIVREWSSRLNAGDNAGIARLFALPATLYQRPFVSRFHNRRDIAAWFSDLPCAGHVVSIRYRGRFATAVFRLSDRGAHPCDAPGTLAAARFEFVRGNIVSWAQVAVPPDEQRPPTLTA